MTEIQAVFITRREQAELLPRPLDSRPLGPREVSGPTVVSLLSPGTELSWLYTAADVKDAEPGYAAVFRIEQVGAEVTGLAPGDLALCMGNHRSRQRHMQDSVARVPAGLAPECAAFARLMGVGMSTLTTTAARPPEKVVVTGLGPVGNLAARIFASCGYTVLGCDPVASRRELARSGGLSNVVEKLPLEDPTWQDQVALAIDCSGHEGAALDCCRLVRPGGEVVLLGTPWRKRTELSAHEVMHIIFHRYVHLRSGWEWELPWHAADFRHNSIWGNIAGALEWLAAGRIATDGLATACSPRACQAVYQSLLHNPGQHFTALFDWRLL